MIKIENTSVSGFEPAIRGMRNPKNSWGLSDSKTLDAPVTYYPSAGLMEQEEVDSCEIDFLLGEKDGELAEKLNKGGSVHAKYRRMIVVWTDITAPLYWWKEFDTYKVGTVANSCSTMHKIADKEFELSDFSCEHLYAFGDFGKGEDPLKLMANGLPVIMIDEDSYWSPAGILASNIKMLNKCRNLYLQTKDKRYWWQMIQLLPSSYNQKRTVMLSYEVLANIWVSRKGHKLDEWHRFRDWIYELPYSSLITGDVEL